MRFQHPAWSQAHAYCLATTTGRNGMRVNCSLCGPHQGLLMYSGFLLLLSQVTTNLVAETAQIHSLTVLVSNQAGSVSLGGLQSVDGLSVSPLDTDGRNCLLVFSSSLTLGLFFYVFQLLKCWTEHSSCLSSLLFLSLPLSTSLGFSPNPVRQSRVSSLF